MRTIALIAHFSGDAGAQKIHYLECLDVVLRRRGHRLLLIDQAGAAIQTACDTRCYLDASGGADSLAQSLSTAKPVADAIAVDAGHEGRTALEISGTLLPAALQIRQCIREEQSTLAVLWHQFNGMSMLLRYLLEQDRLPFVYAHLGALPGTICFEPGGQMAESWVCTRSDDFRALPVKPEDLEATDRLLDLVRQNRLDRKAQPDAASTRRAIDGLRARSPHIVFYAGQNDFRAGMQPSSFPTARVHSPHFDDTADGLRALRDAARNGSSQIVFKPHPNAHSNAAAPLEGVTTLRDGNVFECILETEVTATIVSATAYLALIHGRPVLLMGRMPLSGKGCTYEVAGRDALGRALSEAMTHGLTNTQAECFCMHAAQLIRYSLFAYAPEIESIIGRGPESAADLLVAATEGSLHLPDPAWIARAR